MASRAGLSGAALGEIALGVMLAWSGIENAPLSATLQSLISGKPPAPGPPGPSSSTSSASSAAAGSVAPALAGQSSISADAIRYAGAGYVWGGAPANGIGNWDCSSFANWVCGHDLGLAIPGYAPGTYTGSSHGPPTGAWLVWGGVETVGHDGNLAMAGDLAIWQTHMGICLGPNQMISAQNPTDGTQLSAINGFIPELLFIRRYAASAPQSAAVPGGRIVSG